MGKSMLIILGIFLVMSIFQAYQITSLKAQFANAPSGVQPSRISPTGSAGGLPSSIKDLPQMVGGC